MQIKSLGQLTTPQRQSNRKVTPEVSPAHSGKGGSLNKVGLQRTKGSQQKQQVDLSLRFKNRKMGYLHHVKGKLENEMSMGDFGRTTIFLKVFKDAHVIHSSFKRALGSHFWMNL